MIELNFLEIIQGNYRFDKFSEGFKNKSLHEFLSEPIIENPTFAYKWFVEEKMFVLKRNIFSLTPIFFTFNQDKYFKSSTSIKDLYNTVDLSVNHFYIDSYIYESHEIIPHQTLFSNIFQLPPACILIVEPHKISLKYEEFNFYSNSNNIYQALKKSIGSSVDKYQNIASHVSGGLDSTGLSSILQKDFAHKNLQFCIVDTSYDSVSEDEYQKAFTTKYQKQVVKYDPGKSVLDFTKAYIEFTGVFPQLANVPTVNTNLIESLKNQGFEALIIGEAGDGIIGHGKEHLHYLQKLKDKQNLQKTFENFAKGNVLKDKYLNWNTFSANKKYNLVMFFFMFKNLKKDIFNLKHWLFLFKLSRGFQGFYEYFQKIISNKRAQIKLKSNNEYSKPNECIIYENKPIKAYQDFLSYHMGHIYHFYYNLSQMFKIDIVMPFLNHDVLSYTINKTAEEKFGLGYTRNYYRKEMDGILPPEVQWRIDKAAFDEYFLEEVYKYYLDSEANISAKLYRFVNEKSLKALFSEFKNIKHDTLRFRNLAFFLYRVLNINTWLLSIEKNEKK